MQNPLPKVAIATLFCLLATSQLPSQNTFFQKTFGTPIFDIGYDVLPLADGYLLAGEVITTFDNSDAVLLRTDANGNRLWQRNFGDPAKSLDKITSVELANDGGFVAWGTFQNPTTGNFEARLLKLDTLGRIIWEKTLRRAQNDCPATGRIVPTTDGYMVNFDQISSTTGNATSAVARFSTSGELLWNWHFYTSNNDPSTTYQTHLPEDADGRLFVVGGSNSPAGIYFISKINADSAAIYFRHYDGGNREIFTDAVRMHDGNLLVCGITQNADAETQILLTKISLGGIVPGNVIWMKKWAIASWQKHNPQLETTSDGGFLLLTDNVLGDAQLTRLDTAGNAVWDRSFGGPGYHSLRRVRQSADGGFVLAGMTAGSGQGSGDIFLVKTDSAGNIASCEPEVVKIFDHSNYQTGSPNQFTYGHNKNSILAENLTTPASDQQTLVQADFCKKPLSQWFVDADKDGFGDSENFTWSALQPPGTSTVGGDCDDSNPKIYPGSTELPNGVDDDCDGSVDEGTISTADADALPKFQVFPNPVRLELRLVFGQSIFSETAFCRVSDLAGRVLISEKLEAGKREFSLNLENLSTGAYLVRVGGTARLFFKV